MCNLYIHNECKKLNQNVIGIPKIAALEKIRINLLLSVKIEKCLKVAMYIVQNYYHQKMINV